MTYQDDNSYQTYRWNNPGGPVLPQSLYPQQESPANPGPASNALNAYPTTQRPNSYYAGNGVNAVMEVQYRLQGAFLGWLGVRAGRNSYAMCNDVQTAVMYGAHALRRWWIWLFFTKVWFLMTLFCGFMYSLGKGDYLVTEQARNGQRMYVTLMPVLLIIAFVLGVMVPYCRNINYSLFKRNFVYRLFSPLADLLIQVPNGVLYISVPMALLLPTFLTSL